MLTLDQYDFIRTAHRVYGQNISEVAKTTGHARNTVKKALRGEPCGYKKRNNGVPNLLRDKISSD